MANANLPRDYNFKDPATPRPEVPTTGDLLMDAWIDRLIDEHKLVRTSG